MADRRIRRLLAPVVPPPARGWIRSIERPMRLRLASAPWRTRDVTCVVVLAEGRTGSSLLCDYLSSLPGVDVAGEVLHRLVAADRSISRRAALAHLKRSILARRGAVRGAKVHLSELARLGLSVDDLAEVLPEARLILLYRRSLAEQYVSREVKEATGQAWTSRRGAFDDVVVEIDPEKFARYCRRVRSAYEAALASDWVRRRAVVVEYREVTDDPERLFADRICPHLDVPYRPPSSDHARGRTTPLVRTVANHQELEALFSAPLAHQDHDLERDLLPLDDPPAPGGTGDADAP